MGGHHSDLPLGKQTEYISVYTPSLLCAIERSQGRDALAIDNRRPPFSGVDVWNAYEISWLDTHGKPQVAVGRFWIPCKSPCLVESKSLKLYLNSLNQTRFASYQDVVKTIESDLSVCARAPVTVKLNPLNVAAREGLASPVGHCLDDLAVEVDVYEPDAKLLELVGEPEPIAETLYSNLLKSNCPVTGQPDWATLSIKYRGRPIHHASLLKYIVSYRQHSDFHEQCVERIFRDIMAVCGPEKLTVYALYTRRGGLDINPFRTNCGDEADGLRLARQ